MKSRLFGAVCALFFVSALQAPALAGAVRPGFSSSTLPRNDDDSTGPISLGFTADFFGLSFTQVYVNNNGNVTFDAPLNAFTPFDLTSTGRQIIAPFFADVDTRNAGAVVTFGPGQINGRRAFGVNWVSVDCFSSDPSRSVRNNFQLVLIEREDTGAGNFDFELNYDSIQWESGQASGGNSQCRGGASARAGYSNGTGVSGTFFELPGSGVPGAFLDDGPAATALIHNRMNSDVLGRYTFSARNGTVVVCPDADDDDLCDDEDNCPNAANPGQDDGDGDGVGDACDACPNDATNSDTDSDGICDDDDNCPHAGNPDQRDDDGDGEGDACDSCPGGAGGDPDGDGLCGNDDPCPYDRENDADGDRICGDADVCPGTVLPEVDVPSIRLRVNHWADINGDGVFETTPPPGGGHGPRLSFTLEHTGGCSCTQIIEELGLGKGHRKFGCSNGVMREWVAFVASQRQAQASACDATGRSSGGAALLVLLAALVATRRRAMRAVRGRR